ncbi:hypothetical protein AGLY_000469 [Aphis glycines]|uniref:Uncharacterized protein n=1 Tax=Aphis glycines TaxID=307491 RepID=A0A6G0U9M5_APHGL|nr:hypothetical protein AGLY_000469 [Aphis glycines]
MPNMPIYYNNKHFQIFLPANAIIILVMFKTRYHTKGQMSTINNNFIWFCVSINYLPVLHMSGSSSVLSPQSSSPSHIHASGTHFPLPQVCCRRCYDVQVSFFAKLHYKLQNQIYSDEVIKSCKYSSPSQAYLKGSEQTHIRDVYTILKYNCSCVDKPVQTITQGRSNRVYCIEGRLTSLQLKYQVKHIISINELSHNCTEPITLFQFPIINQQCNTYIKRVYESFKYQPQKSFAVRKRYKPSLNADCKKFIKFFKSLLELA